MGDPNCGLYGKFYVERTDARSAPGEKHADCEYFCLDLNHDPHAAPALEAYAYSCQKAYPLLARDLLKKAQDIRARLDGDAPKGIAG